MSYQATMNAELDKMRANGLSIDGDNDYKRDLLNAVTGALAFGKQRSTPPPAGHWLEPFYEMGKAEADERDAASASQSVGVPDRDSIHLAFEHKLRAVNMPHYGEHKGDWRTLTREEMADVVRELFCAAPTVKAEQVDDRAECIADGLSVGMSQEEAEEFADKIAIHSLPAAGSAVGDGPDITTKHGYPAYSVAQHERIVAQLRADLDECDGERWKLRTKVQQLEALSAQQPAPERVSVPVELLERLETWVTDDCSALEELRTLLASHGRG